MVGGERLALDPPLITPMESIDIDLTGHTDPDGLRKFYTACKEAALDDAHDKIACIRLAVDHLDPLAVLDSIYEPGSEHFYLESPAEGIAMAGAEAIVRTALRGPQRFAAARAFADEWFEHTISIGDPRLPHGGPLCFFALPFFDDEASGEQAGCIFIPTWQVVRTGSGYMAVANARIGPETDIEPLAQRLWAAYLRFRDSAYEAPGSAPGYAVLNHSEVGPQGRFQANVTDALEAIAGGRYQKIVLARALDVTTSQPIQPLRTLHHLRQRFPKCHCYSFQSQPNESFIGATPECLLTVNGQTLATEAIAGSAPRSSDPVSDAAQAAALLRSDKDLREHRHVIESIRRRLSGLVADEMQHADQPQLLQLANVQHLHTPIHARLRSGIHPLEAAAALHPTPALGGTPRATALADIRRLEPFERGLFGGLIGWLDPLGGCRSIVAIRCARIRGNALRLFAGAGIVEGSVPQNEDAETRLKMQALIDAISLRLAE